MFPPSKPFHHVGMKISPLTHLKKKSACCLCCHQTRRSSEGSAPFCPYPSVLFPEATGISLSLNRIPIFFCVCVCFLFLFVFSGSSSHLTAADCGSVFSDCLVCLTCYLILNHAGLISTGGGRGWGGGSLLYWKCMGNDPVGIVAACSMGHLCECVCAPVCVFTMVSFGTCVWPQFTHAYFSAGSFCR